MPNIQWVMRQIFPGTVALFLLAFPLTLNAQTLYDDFSPKWTVEKRGTGVVSSEVNQRLEVTVAANASQGADSIFLDTHRSTCVLEGNFDIQVDYLLLLFPPQSGMRIGLGVETAAGYYFIERTSFSPADQRGLNRIGHNYVTDFRGTLSFVPASDQGGKLKLMRQGQIVSGFYFDQQSSSWKQVGSGSIPGQ
ncbi:MAG: hypothetical protein Q8O11_08010, partial [Syntrophales bacterium]|nr:hypothetical protein [Syntrophales bacterium]